VRFRIEASKPDGIVITIAIRISFLISLTSRITTGAMTVSTNAPDHFDGRARATTLKTPKPNPTIMGKPMVTTLRFNAGDFANCDSGLCMPSFFTEENCNNAPLAFLA
jgi:hypothetical protein